MSDWRERVRTGAPIAWPVAAGLQAATLVQRVGMWRRLRHTPQRVQAQVVSFGNLTAGGTGKTPAVIARAQQELAKGRRVAVLTRGYGSRPARTPQVCDTTRRPTPTAEEWGDEPALIARAAPQVFLVKCSDRVAAARAAVDECGCEVLLLDDGFQAVALARNEDVVTLDTTNPFGGGPDGRVGHLVPRGILREWPAALARATHLVLTHCDHAPNLKQVMDEIRHYAPDAALRLTRHAPVRLWNVATGEAAEPAWLQGREVDAACGIGAPEHFRSTLARLGAQLQRFTAVRDHQALPAPVFETERVVVVTEKDAVRLAPPPANAWALSIALEDHTP